MGVDTVRTLRAGKGQSPMDYLAWSYFEPSQCGPGSPRPEAHWLGPSRDCVVWANRGGGKTLLGAVATALDLLFKPGVQVRVLGGSLEQSSKMHAHLVSLFDRPMLREALASPPTTRRIELHNGSSVELLAGSQRSVRGVRVHKLRCDEVEEFDADVWQAAQMVTRSGWCGPVYVTGAVQALSTMHRPGGLMSQLVSKAGARVFKWNAMDVAARCEEERACASCVLWKDCGGWAKRADGFVPIDDLIAQRSRTSDVTWQAEMLCERPAVDHAVYAGFSRADHVRERIDDSTADARFVAGMDFGLRSPLVMLWGISYGRGPSATLHIVGEYVQTDLTLERHLYAIDAHRLACGAPPAIELAFLAVDPAGNARNSHSGESDVNVLQRFGYRVRSRASRIEQGIEHVRRRLDRGTLFLHPRCERLIESLERYHFDMSRPGVALPVKDGPDHACDALRYLINALEADVPATWRSYL